MAFRPSTRATSSRRRKQAKGRRRSRNYIPPGRDAPKSWKLMTADGDDGSNKKSEAVWWKEGQCESCSERKCCGKRKNGRCGEGMREEKKEGTMYRAPTEAVSVGLRRQRRERARGIRLRRSVEGRAVRVLLGKKMVRKTGERTLRRRNEGGEERGHDVSCPYRGG